MKKEMNFDHEAPSLVRALNVDPHSFANQLAAVMAIYEASDDDKLSRLSQLIHNCVDYRIILLMATTSLVNMIAQHRDYGNIDDLLGNLSNN
jgi:DhnA family fructose-bisphosphate aldolase class Ia